jgi:hypothetical protein
MVAPARSLSAPAAVARLISRAMKPKPRFQRYNAMTSMADDYRSRAADCEMQAAAANNALTRQQLTDLAEVWRLLARDAEMLERIAADRRAS